MTERKHQQSLIKWSQQPRVREKWPELKLMYHVPNERYCTPAQGKQLKLSGVRKGVPDLCLPVARKDYHGLYIEMKTETGRESPEQVWWREQLTEQGYFVEACHGWESAVRVVEWYMYTGEEV